MLLIPIRKKDGRLFLEAYSYSVDELKAVSIVLSACGIQPKYDDLPYDKEKREGRRYILHPSDVPQIEKYLAVEFKGVEGRTVTRITGGGQSFQCQEIALHGGGNGCINLMAAGQIEATVKCALVANNKRWFGGVATPGVCEKSPSLGKQITGALGSLMKRSR